MSFTSLSCHYKYLNIKHAPEAPKPLILLFSYNSRLLFFTGMKCKAEKHPAVSCLNKQKAGRESRDNRGGFALFPAQEQQGTQELAGGPSAARTAKVMGAAEKL